MKIVLAPDSFKGSLSAVEVAQAMELGVRRAAPACEIETIPMADGGEGTVEALVRATEGTIESAVVLDPLMREITACYGVLGLVASRPPARRDGETAVIEIAAASGLPLLAPGERKPLQTTSYGTGELVRAVLDRGCRGCIIGLGGSATVDCGAGMLQALGIKFLRADGGLVPPGCGGGDLLEIAAIDRSGLDPRIGQCEFTIASDVRNPLLGAEGAARVFAPQKGASRSDVERLETNLAHFAALIERATERDIRSYPGTGAAGGLGAALLAFFDAEIRLGIDVVMELTRFAEKLQGAQLVITGEGQMDYQTTYGKTCAGVARAAHEAGVPVIAIVGAVPRSGSSLRSIGGRIPACSADRDDVKQIGISEVVPISELATLPGESFSRARELIAMAAENVVRTHFTRID